MRVNIAPLTHPHPEDLAQQTSRRIGRKKDKRHVFVFPRHDLPGFCSNRCPSKDRGRRECRVFGTPAASCAKVESTRVSHYRSAETIRPSLRDGLRLMARSPRGAGLGSLRHLPIIIGKLDASVGASGPHAFAVRSGAFVSRARSVHRIPRPTFVTIGRSVPLFGGGMRTDNHVFLKNGSENFASTGSAANQVDIARQIRRCAQRVCTANSAIRRNDRAEIDQVICPSATI